MIFLNKTNYTDCADGTQNNNLVLGFGDKSIDFQTKNTKARFDLIKQIRLNEHIEDENYFNIAELNQVHGNAVISVEEHDAKKFSKKIIDADGIFTSLKHYLLCIKTADCIPLLFYDKISGTIGTVHCGWRGLYNDILINSADMLKHRYNANIEKVAVVIGPGICKHCYTVKEDLREKFINKDINYKNYFAAKYADAENDNCAYGNELNSGNSANSAINDAIGSMEYLFDLKGLIKYVLFASGFRKENIRDMNLCTYENEDYFSYRKNKTASRFVSFIGKL
jgi:YfiH family protein